MANEILSIPEDDLKEVIMVIRVGLKHCATSPEVREQLNIWCNEEEDYLKGL